MTTTAEMLKTHPRQIEADADLFAQCADACFECAESCTACADACLSEEQIAELRTCVRLNLDCVDICESVGKVLLRQTGRKPETLRAHLEAVIAVVGACAEECERHAQKHEHCRICAEVCRRCEQSCLRVLGGM